MHCLFALNCLIADHGQYLTGLNNILNVNLNLNLFMTTLDTYIEMYIFIRYAQNDLTVTTIPKD